MAWEWESSSSSCWPGLFRTSSEMRVCPLLSVECLTVTKLTTCVVAVSILGFLLGPVYPCAQTIFTRLLPGSAQVIAIGFISSAGSSGGAVVPFTTGLLAQASGTWVLHPVCIGFFVVMLASWALLPKVGKRHE